MTVGVEAVVRHAEPPGGRCDTVALPESGGWSTLGILVAEHVSVLSVVGPSYGTRGRTPSKARLSKPRALLKAAAEPVASESLHAPRAPHVGPQCASVPETSEPAPGEPRPPQATGDVWAVSGQLP